MKLPVELMQLESESIYIMREVAASFENSVLLYSVGKDSSVLLQLARKAFFPGPIPFKFMHIDTTMKFREMIEFRDATVKKFNLSLDVSTNQKAVNEGMNPFTYGTSKCCGELKTKALKDGLLGGGYDAAIGGARRDEEKSRAKERVFSMRDKNGKWDPKLQQPELWNLYNPLLNEGATMRVFPLSNWTELDVWHYIKHEEIDIVPLYFAKKRKVAKFGKMLIPIEHLNLHPDQKKYQVVETSCRFRTLGCTPCTGAIESQADNIDKIIDEVRDFRKSERSTRVIDHDKKGSMELKKREGYF